VYLNFRVQLGFVSGLMQGDEHDKSIFVHLNSINGTFDAYILAFDDQTPISAYRHPSPEDFFWSITTSGSRSLIIDEDDPHYVGNGTYFIEVTAKSPMSQFEILFTTERSIIPIRLGLPHYDVLEQNQLQFYELSYEPSHEELTIIISTDDGENSEQCLKTSYSTWE
jgi:hypothetical protein